MRSHCIARHCTGFRVLAAVKLDREPQRWTIKIQDETAGRMLAAKIGTKLAISKPLPKAHFDIREVAAKLPCA